jgi:hypothetical protein
LTLLLSIALLGGCAAEKPPALPAAPAAPQSLVIPGALEPYRVRGAAQFTYRGETQSGELLLEAQPGPVFRIQLRARVTGSLALDVRVSAADLLVIDYVHESYVLSSNTPDLREELFSLDLTPLDLQLAVTGRVPEAVFEAGHGTRLPGEARFDADGAQYRFTLGADGMPGEWVKLRDGVPVLRVEYRGMLDAQPPAGAPLRLPARLRIFAGDPPPRLVLGVQAWQLAADVPPIGFLPPPEVLERFKAR